MDTTSSFLKYEKHLQLEHFKIRLYIPYGAEYSIIIRFRVKVPESNNGTVFLHSSVFVETNQFTDLKCFGLMSNLTSK